VFCEAEVDVELDGEPVLALALDVADEPPPAFDVPPVCVLEADALGLVAGADVEPRASDPEDDRELPAGVELEPVALSGGPPAPAAFPFEPELHPPRNAVMATRNETRAVIMVRRLTFLCEYRMSSSRNGTRASRAFTP